MDREGTAATKGCIVQRVTPEGGWDSVLGDSHPGPLILGHFGLLYGWQHGLLCPAKACRPTTPGAGRWGSDWAALTCQAQGRRKGVGGPGGDDVMGLRAHTPNPSPSTGGSGRKVPDC